MSVGGEKNHPTPREGQGDAPQNAEESHPDPVGGAEQDGGGICQGCQDLRKAGDRETDLVTQGVNHTADDTLLGCPGDVPVSELLRGVRLLKG